MKNNLAASDEIRTAGVSTKRKGAKAEEVILDASSAYADIKIIVIDRHRVLNPGIVYSAGMG